MMLNADVVHSLGRYAIKIINDFSIPNTDRDDIVKQQIQVQTNTHGNRN